MSHKLSRWNIRYRIVSHQHMRFLGIDSSFPWNAWINLRFNILIIHFNRFHCLIVKGLHLILLILLIVTNCKVLFSSINSFLSTSFILLILIMSQSWMRGWWSPLIWLLLILRIISEIELSFSEIQSCLLSLIKSVLLRVTNYVSWKIHFSRWLICKWLFPRSIIEVLHFGFDHLRSVFIHLKVSIH